MVSIANLIPKYVEPQTIYKAINASQILDFIFFLFDVDCVRLQIAVRFACCPFRGDKSPAQYMEVR
jgi:hypothetical protein